MNNNKIAKFKTVSYEQFEKDMIDTFDGFYSKDEIAGIYETIKLPRRATTGSAGYDFFTHIPFSLKPNQSIKIPTGIRCIMENDWVLKLYPRSGLGFKYRLQLDNSVGVVDSDYYYSDNEGHIFIKITNDGKEGKIINLKEGDAFAQGIFLQYGITMDDDTDGVRNGGFGSTEK